MKHKRAIECLTLILNGELQTEDDLLMREESGGGLELLRETEENIEALHMAIEALEAKKAIQSS